MSQTFVLPGGQAPGIAGMIADSYEAPDITSGFNMDVLQIPFGYGLMKQPGAVDERAYVLASGLSGTAKIEGPSVYDLAHSRAGGLDANGNYSGDMGASGLLPKAALQVGRKGRFWVPVEGTVQVNDGAFCRTVATGALAQGIWAGSGLAGFHVDMTKLGVFRSQTFTAADGSTRIAILEYNATNKP